MTALRAKGICKRFARSRGGWFSVLEAVACEVTGDSLVVIRGISGCGKTTLLQILATLSEPDSGELWIDDERVADWSAETLASFRRLRLGLMHQEPALISRSTVVENVGLALIPEGLSRGHRHRLAKERLRQVGLADLAEEVPRTLSGGERQRVALARALLTEPDVIIADEPTSQVDPATTDLIVELLRAERDRGAAVLVASHDPRIWSAADELYELDEGRLSPVRVS